MAKSVVATGQVVDHSLPTSGNPNNTNRIEPLEIELSEENTENRENRYNRLPKLLKLFFVFGIFASAASIAVKKSFTDTNVANNSASPPSNLKTLHPTTLPIDSPSSSPTIKESKICSTDEEVVNLVNEGTEIILAIPNWGDIESASLLALFMLDDLYMCIESNAISDKVKPLVINKLQQLKGYDRFKEEGCTLLLDKIDGFISYLQGVISTLPDFSFTDTFCNTLNQKNTTSTSPSEEPSAAPSQDFSDIPSLAPTQILLSYEYLMKLLDQEEKIIVIIAKDIAPALLSQFLLRLADSHNNYVAESISKETINNYENENRVKLSESLKELITDEVFNDFPKFREMVTDFITRIELFKEVDENLINYFDECNKKVYAGNKRL